MGKVGSAPLSEEISNLVFFLVAVTWRGELFPVHQLTETTYTLVGPLIRVRMCPPLRCTGNAIWQPSPLHPIPKSNYISVTLTT